jgi:hypothetical protein
MKKLEKISLANIEGKLTRKEMKTIMAGSGEDCADGTVKCTCNGVYYGCQTINACWNKC